MPEIPTGSAPVCPRHPDRVSYVRCQRCERPVCPECQRPAPVGIQCVDCVRAGARATAPRVPFGDGRAPTRPVVTIAVVVACVAVYLLQISVPGFTGEWYFSPAAGAQQPWRFVTSAFLHSTPGFLHILLNMVALWAVGPFLEMSLGRARYIALYLLAAVGGSTAMVVSAFLTGDWTLPVVGASGAVFGLFGAVLVVLRRTGRSAGGIVGVIVLNVVLGFVVPNVAWQAHLGGLAVGAALGAAFAYAPRERRQLVSVVAVAAAATVLVGADVGIYVAAGLF